MQNCIDSFVIEKEWTPPIVDLKGNARVRIYTTTKDPRGAIVMQANEVDLNQTIGEIFRMAMCG